MARLDFACLISSVASNQRNFLLAAARAILLSLLLLSVLLGTGWSQGDPAAGILPFSTQVGGPIDSIDLATSNIHLSIPVRSKIGAIPFTYSLQGNSHAYEYISGNKTWQGVSLGFSGVPNGLMGGRLSYSTMPGTCTIFHFFSVVDPTGAAHPLPAGTQTSTCSNTLPQGVVTTDGSGYTVNFTTKTAATVYDRSGNMAVSVSQGSSGQTTSVSDPDGNTNSASSSTNGAFTNTNYNDTLIPSGTPYAVASSTALHGGGNPGPDTYQYADGSGTTQQVQVNYSLYTWATTFGCAGVEVGPSSWYLPSAITVPGGGQYGIYYESTQGPGFSGDVTGRISKITLPSGGSVSYTYSGGINNSGVYCNNGEGAVPTLTRTVTDNNGHSASWSYFNSGVSFPSNNFTVTETDPANNQTVYSFFSGYQTQAEYYQGSAVGTPLKTVLTCYNGNFSNCATWQPSANPLQITQTDVYTSFSGSSSNLVETKFDSYGNTVEVKQYDFGAAMPPAGNPVSDTLIYYGQSWNGTSCTTYPSGPYIRNTPCYSHTKNSSGTDIAKTQITYSPTGHATQTQSWVSAAAPSWLTTSTASYNSNGTPAWTKDALSNQTTYSYNGTGGCNNLLATSVSYPVNSLSTSQTWDCNGGVVTKTTDANGNPTTYAYADPLWRQTQVGYPDGGGTTITYNTGSTLPWSISTSTAINSTTNLNGTTIYDGLGRVTQTQLTSDPDGTDYVDTTYDLLGRQATVSNPHRSTSSTTDGTTSYSYDAINRVIRVTDPDASSSSNSYTFSSNTFCTTSTDEVGNSRQSCSDGLGRVTKVLEDPGNSPHLNYETDYTYNALNNMLTVAQKGTDSAHPRPRTFYYDGLSRLTEASNPESGNTFYAYALSGGTLCAGDPSALCTKTAPSPNAAPSGNSVVTTYAYDGMNRLTRQSYVDSYTSNPLTPSVQYGYDGVALTGCTPAPPGLTDSNPKGIRTAMCDGSGATSWKHDQMGRILQERRTIGSVVGDYETDTYNLNGSPTTVTSLGYGVTYNYGGAGRALTATNYTGGTNKLVSGATYAPPGGLATMTMGSTTSFTGIVTNNAYNNRLQPILLSAGVSGQNPVFSLCYDFHLGVAVNTAPCSFSASNPPSDNGNAYQVVNNRDNTRSQSFTYDSLNRIASGQSSGTQWGEAFTIDAWGNMTAIGSYNGKPHESLSTSANANNQLVGFGYDLAGNMTSNGSATYVYDAESRLIAAGGDSYLYDGDGNRVEKCTEDTPGVCASGATGTLYWRGNSPDALSETDLAGNVQNNYVFFNGQRVARRDSGGGIHYYFSDQLGSHGVVENATASACEQDIDYFPYGGVENDYCPNVAQNYKFTGKERDSEDAPNALLDYFGARHYASSLGRFMVPDPVGIFVADASNPQSWNLYAYVLNNPLNAIDPLGLECVWDDGSFDSADDPVTGSASGCAGQGGTWVDPDLFENAMLTNGQWNSNYGDWSGSANANLAQNWVVPSGGVNADAIDANSILSSLSSDLSYGLSFTRSFFGGFTVNVGPGSCLRVAASSFTPVVNAAKKVQDYSKNYVAPVVASLPGMGASLANGVYSTVQYGADRGNALEMGGAISAAATFLATKGQTAVTAMANAAKNPAVALGTADLALAWGIGNEAVAAYQGTCYF